MRIAAQLSTEGYDGITTSAMLNLETGGMNGYMPRMAAELAGKPFENWISNTAHVKEPVIPFCLRTPKLFDVLKDRDLGKFLKKVYVEVFTVHALKITGFTRTLTVETAEHSIGRLDEKQEEVIKVRKERTNITYTFEDKLGQAISKFLEFLIGHTLRDYRTGKALGNTLDVGDEFRKGNRYTADYYTGTFLYVVTDMVNVTVDNAYITYGLFPKGTGDLTNELDIEGSLEIQVLDVPVAGITFSDEGVTRYAQKYVDNVSIFKQNPDQMSKVAITKDEANVVSGLVGGYNLDTYNVEVDGFADNKDAFAG